MSAGQGTSIRLTRIDPARRMARFYELSLQPDLFGGVTLVREWGRIGAAGQVMSICYEDEATALVACEALRQRKQRRGYIMESGLSRPILSGPHDCAVSVNCLQVLVKNEFS